MKRIHIQLLVLSVAILFIWWLPYVAGDMTNRIVMGWIAGWQIGDWAWQIADYLDDKYNV